jgi:glyoxylase-like metal-dependent hydrolase (beta-lactamase superfamily II)
MDSIKEVAPDIFMVTQAIRSRQFKSSVNLFVFAGNDGLIFDSGYGGRRKKAGLVQTLGQISQIKKSRGEPCVISRAMPSHGHWDHFSGLGHFQEVLGLRILATQNQVEKMGSKKAFKASLQSERPFFNHRPSPLVKILHKIRDDVGAELFMGLARVCFVPGPIDIIDENDLLSINGEAWQMIPAPGHCDDDIVLYNRERGILLGGDVVLRSITTWLGPPRSNLKMYLESLERIRQLPNLNLILSAHGSPIKNPVERIQGAIEHREKRTSDLFQLVLKSGKKGLAYGEIFNAVYPGANRFKRFLLGGWILVTLQYLWEEGAIFTLPRCGEIKFCASS